MNPCEFRIEVSWCHTHADVSILRGFFGKRKNHTKQTTDSSTSELVIGFQWEFPGYCIHTDTLKQKWQSILEVWVSNYLLRECWYRDSIACEYLILDLLFQMATHFNIQCIVPNLHHACLVIWCFVIFQCWLKFSPIGYQRLSLKSP